jgi:hypothetical protein
MEHERSEFKNAANTVEMLQIAWGMDRTGNKQKIIQNGEKPTNYESLWTTANGELRRKPRLP